MMDSKERKQFKENLELLEHDEETQSRVIQIIWEVVVGADSFAR